MGKQKKELPLCIIAALTWFGYHCGAGFASGRQVWLYAAQYGKKGVLAPLIIWTIEAVIMYISAEYARLRKAKSYKDMVTIYSDNPAVSRVALFLWDILIFMAAITVSASCTAGTGSLLQSVFGLPYFAGCAVFVLGMALILSLGKGILERLGKMGVPLIVVFFCICFVAVGRNSGHLVEVMKNSTPVTEISAFAFFKKCLVYTITQCSFFQALSVLAGRFESRRESVVFTVSGFLMNCLAMLACYFALMAYYPEIGESKIPMFNIANSFDGFSRVVLVVAYNFVLILAYITTAGSALAGGQARYTPVLIRWLKTEELCRAFVTVAFLAGASLLSTLGLDGILTTVNTVNSVCRAPVWFLPFLILGPLAVIRAKRADQAQNC